MASHSPSAAALPPTQKAPAAAAPPAEEPAAAVKGAGATATVTVAPAAKEAKDAVATHPPKKRPELSRVASVGLVSNDSIQEAEVEHFFAPEAALEEEERLRKEREERQQEAAAADPPSEVRPRLGSRAQTTQPGRSRRSRHSIAAVWCVPAAGAVPCRHPAGGRPACPPAATRSSRRLLTRPSSASWRRCSTAPRCTPSSLQSR